MQSGVTFRNWNSIYHKFRAWYNDGVFEKILQSLVDDCLKFYLVEINSTFCKVHQRSTGARKIFGNQNIGVSRGGKTTKIHALVNEHFRLISVDLTGGNIHDSEVAIKLLSKVALKGKKILADTAFCSEEIRKYISHEKAAACIPDKSNAVNIHDFDKELYRARNIVERFISAYQKFQTHGHSL